MAQRFGGKYSPGGAGGSTGKAPDWHAQGPARTGARANLMFLFPIPFAIAAFFGSPVHMAVKLTAVALLILAAWLTREGLRAEAAWEARPVARRPAFPRKMFGALALGLGLGFGGWSASGGLFDPLILGALGAALHFTAFGPDPMRDKNLEGVDIHQSDRAARAVQEAERHLTEMTQAIRRLGDRHLADRVAVLQGNVREMVTLVESDPRRLTAARRYLGVYLLGARDATTKFAALYADTRDPAARADYEALLDDLDRNFAARSEALRAGDRTALDIEMEVLRDRLAREGVRPDTD